MGRSVSYPRDTVALTFTTYDPEYEATEDDVADGYAGAVGDWIDDGFTFDDLLYDFKSTCLRRWPSLSECDEWLGREDHAVLRNAFVHVGLSEYCGLISFWIVARDDDPALTGLATAWARRIAPAFEAEFGTLRKLGHMSNGEGVYERIAA